MADTPYIAERNTRANSRIVVLLSGLVAGMVGLSFAAVPLYSMFCAVTGYGGTTQRADGNPKGVIAREMTTRFDATVAPGLLLKIVPSKPVSDEIGTVRTITFEARNLSSKPVSTTAGFNVTPDLAGLYFNKIECFCFTEQTLQPGETVDMPVTFFVDPDLDENSDLDTIREITLSYTFYADD